MRKARGKRRGVGRERSEYGVDIFYLWEPWAIGVPYTGFSLKDMHCRREREYWNG